VLEVLGMGEVFARYQRLRLLTRGQPAGPKAEDPTPTAQRAPDEHHLDGSA
jgi:hypothetical protein